MNELNKLDSGIVIFDDQFILKGNVLKYEANKELQFETYDDHRMAMAFSLLCYRVKYLRIQNTEVVSKSCPNFWNELKKIGVYLE
jgi:3-phosphoshikimate 1-carboxyvinyltransferase